MSSSIAPDGITGRHRARRRRARRGLPALVAVTVVASALSPITHAEATPVGTELQVLQSPNGADDSNSRLSCGFFRRVDNLCSADCPHLRLRPSMATIPSPHSHRLGRLLQ